MNISIQDTATPALRKTLAGVTDKRPLLERLGARLTLVLRRHFLERNQVPNAKGWKKLGFWADVRRRTALGEVTAASATVIISHPAFAHKLFGGTIRPRNAKSLAIPLREEAYGNLPSSGTIPGLFFMRGRRNSFLAVREGKGLRLMYLLTKSVTQKPDPNALPPQSAIQESLTKETQLYLTRS